MRRVLPVFVGLVFCLALAPAEKVGVFRDVTKSSGVKMRLGSDLMRLKLIPGMIGGCAVGDYDGDGRPDLYVTNSIPHWGKANTESCGRLYRNVGGGRFEDVTAKSGVRACGLGMGAFWADLDGDGRLDLYLTNVGANAVWWNRGDGTFEEGKDTGLEDPLFSVGAAFLDYDGDGRLDVAVANYLDSTPEWEAAQPQFELRVPEDYVGQPSHLFRNLGGRRFKDVTAEAGLAVPPSETKTLGIAVLDYDGDGRDDLYFVADRVSNRLFRNLGNGRFEETTAETGAGVLGDRPRAGMGVAVGDPFGSGRESLFVTNFGAEPNSLYRNLDGILFEDAGASSGAGPIGQPAVRWGTGFADFDNDGWEDLVLCNGHVFRHTPGGTGQKPIVLHNEPHPKLTGERWFADVSRRGGSYFQAVHRGRGLAIGDLNNDGYPDVIVSHVNEPVAILRNEAKSGHHWLGVQLVGRGHADTVGAKATLQTEGRTLTRFVKGGGSYLSSSDRRLLFGLGASTRAGRLTVAWPSGRTEHWDELAIDRYHRLEEGSGAAD